MIAYSFDLVIRGKDADDALLKALEYLQSFSGAQLVKMGHLIEDEALDDDPRCVCGVYRSEHALCGCGEWQNASTYTPTSAWYPYEEWEENR